MKTKITISLILLFVIQTSCTKSFLDQKPISSLTTATFYQTQNDIDQAVNGVYNTLLAYPDVFYINLSEVRSGNFYTPIPTAQRDYYNIASFTLDSSLGALQGAWALGYNTINRANMVLQNIGNVTFTSDAVRKQYIAECKFLRAEAYFEMVKVFGRLPVFTHTITHDEALQIKRSPVADVYAVITQDLNDAIVDLPASYPAATKGKATANSARGILARVYLTMAGYPLQKTENYDKARVLLENIIAQEGNNGVKFATNYKDLFNSNNDNTYFLFEVQYISGGVGLGSPIPGEDLPNDINKSIAAYGAYYIDGVPSLNLIGSYEPNDLREPATISFSYLNNKNSVTNKNYFSKFLEPGKVILNNADWPINFPILRYEDVLLMEAEILNEQASSPPAAAVALLNRIRTRAGLPAISPATTAAFRLAMENERRHEFAWEGLYWPDLVRTGRAVTVLNSIVSTEYPGTVVDQNQLIYPVPRSEIQIYPGLYTQNPGYN